MRKAIVKRRRTPLGMRPDKLRCSRVTFRDDQNAAAEGADRRDIPTGGEPRLGTALPQNRHRQVQRLLHGSRSQPDPRRNGRFVESVVFRPSKTMNCACVERGSCPRSVQLIPRPTPGISPPSTARAGNSVERKTVFLSVLRGWSQYCFPVGAGLAAVIWLRTSHKSL